jgi:hypothetical protein
MNMLTPVEQRILSINRRTFLSRSAAGIGMAALGSLINSRAGAALVAKGAFPNFAGKA